MLPLNVVSYTLIIISDLASIFLMRLSHKISEQPASLTSCITLQKTLSTLSLCLTIAEIGVRLLLALTAYRGHNTQHQ